VLQRVAASLDDAGKPPRRPRQVRRARPSNKSRPWIREPHKCETCGREVHLCKCVAEAEFHDEEDSLSTVSSSTVSTDSVSVSTRRRRHKHKHRHKHRHYHRHHDPPCPAPYGCYSGVNACYRDACSYRRQITPVCGPSGCYLAETDVLSCPARPAWAPGGVIAPFGCATTVPFCGTQPSCVNGSLIPFQEQTLYTPQVAVVPASYV